MKEIVLEYISKYPTMSVCSISRALVAERPDMFKSFDNARSMVRYYIGSKGEQSRHNDVNKPLPAERSKDYSPYVLPVVNNRILVLSDVHIPFHDNKAIRLAIEYGHKIDANTILLNGDIFDFYAGSKFVKDSRIVNWKAEIESGKQFIEYIIAEFPKAKIIFKIGNHEERFEIYMMQNAPLLFQTDLYNVSDLLNLAEYKIDVIDNKRIVKAGKLNILHGHELRSLSGGVNPSRTAYLKTHKSVMIGHFHRTSLHTEPDLEKKVITCWSTGCLCSLFAEYDVYNKWNQGFAVIYTKGEEYEVENMRIVNGKVVN